MKEKIEKNKWLFKQFTIINRTANIVYGAIQGGIGMNLYNAHSEYERGVFGWVKEHRSFETAMQIYEQYTENDGWDIIEQLDDTFGDDLKTISYDDISKYEIELADYEFIK